MIKKILAACMLTMVLANPVLAITNSINTDPVPVKVNRNTSIKKISIYGNVDVMLVPGESSDVFINGNKDGAEKIKLVYQHDKLEVIATQLKLNEKNIVFIPAKDLERLEINGNGRVFSESILPNSKLDVYINGLCNVKLHSHGAIVVHASPEYELKYIKNERVKITDNIK